MSAGKMHADEIDIDTDLVRRLLAAQFPRWADLPIKPYSTSGTVNAVYRLGEDLAVRLPRVEWGVADVEKEQHWLPRLAPLLPVAIPDVVGVGEPGGGYPWPWSVCRWLDGDNPVEERLADPDALARDLAEFVAAMRRVDLPDAPPAYRGGSLHLLDEAARNAISQLDGMIDTVAATTAWEAALRIPDWAGPPTWVHADLMPGNLLVADGRLGAVIDFATAGVGDPAGDLVPAWNLLPTGARDTFRTELSVDDDTWGRSRGLALAIAVNQLPYYKDTNPVMAANARYAIREILTDVRAAGRSE